MSYRCINAFAYGDEVYSNGCEVEDGAPILKSHRDHFAEVEQTFVARAVEQAEAKPGGLRATPPKKNPVKKATPDPDSDDSEV